MFVRWMFEEKYAIFLEKYNSEAFIDGWSLGLFPKGEKIYTGQHSFLVCVYKHVSF
jgi:hypothetical protein